MNPIFGFLPYYDISSLFNWGSSGMNYQEIAQARRKIHRGKMYKRYRGHLKHR